jgi:hypothetical protein
MVKGQPYKSYKYEQVLKEQLLLSYLSKGSISVEEVGRLPINDRKILLTTLRQAEEEKKKKIEQMREESKMRRFKGR